jgi:O-antigen/teichoic acid export membrane protein
MLGALTELGVNQYATKTLASHPERYRSLFPALLGLKLLATVVYMVLLLALGYAMGYAPAHLSTLIIVGAVQALVGFMAFWRALMQAHQHFRLDTLAGVTDRTVGALPVLALLHWGITLHSYVLSLLAMATLTLLVFGGIAAKRYGLLRPTFRPAALRPVLARSAPFALIFLLFLVQERLGTLLLERWDSPKSAGLFQGAYRFFAMLQMYLWTVLPIFYAKFAQGYLHPVADRARLFRAGMGVVAVPMMAVCGFLYFYAPQLFFLFSDSTPTEIARMSDCLRVLALALALNAIFNIYSTYLTATGKERYVNALLLIAIPLSAAITWMLVGTQGPLAAAWGILGAFALLSLGYVVALARTTDMPIAAGMLLRIAVVATVTAGCFWACHHGGLHWFWAGLLGTAVALAAGWALRMFDLKLVH